MLYTDQKKKPIKIGKKNYTWKAKPGIAKLASSVWNKMYAFLEEVDEQTKYDTLFEQLITITAFNLNLIPQEDLPAIEQIPEEIRTDARTGPVVVMDSIENDDLPIYDEGVFSDAKVLNDTEDDTLDIEPLQNNKVVGLLR